MLQVHKQVVAAFIVGCMVGVLAAGFYFWRRTSSDREELRERALAAYRDLDTARKAQRDAQERAGKLQEELICIREQAYRIENRARNAADRTGSIADQLDRAQTTCTDIARGIDTAEGLLAENGKLLEELGTILQRVQTSGGAGAEQAGTVP
ncbi:hypothetical protein [Gracilinema caldarium]|uniref:hypothetical protein n=1 Tax=Gracilinema caldarium TaxID=215591 RepID=UPI0026F2F225|nr:hypothetical protein [Gracilinema caldarium]